MSIRRYGLDDCVFEFSSHSIGRYLSGFDPDRRQDALAGYLGHLGVAEKIQFAHMFVNDPFAQPTFWQDQ